MVTKNNITIFKKILYGKNYHTQNQEAGLDEGNNYNSYPRQSVSFTCNKIHKKMISHSRIQNLNSLQKIKIVRLEH